MKFQYYYLTFFFLILFCLQAVSKTWKTAASGYWNDSLVWEGGTVPSYSGSDTFIIKHPVAFEENIILNTGAYLQIDSTGGLCGHHNITVNSGVEVIKYGILEADSLFIPGGDVYCYGPGQTILTEYGYVSNGGSLTVNGGSFEVGPWFECVQPEYSFKVTGVEEMDRSLAFSLFPNPNNGTFTLDFPKSSYEATLLISDLQGRIVYRQNFWLSTGKFNIHASNLGNGFYLWEISSANKIAVRGKMVVNPDY